MEWFIPDPDPNFHEVPKIAQEKSKKNLQFKNRASLRDVQFSETCLGTIRKNSYLTG